MITASVRISWGLAVERDSNFVRSSGEGNELVPEMLPASGMRGPLLDERDTRYSSFKFRMVEI